MYTLFKTNVYRKKTKCVLHQYLLINEAIVYKIVILDLFTYHFYLLSNAFSTIIISWFGKVNIDGQHQLG